MSKQLPGIFANDGITVNNNKTVSYSSDNTNSDNKEQLNYKLKGKNINQKINEIFNSTSYIYKADVEITLSNGKIVKRIIGKNRDNLITIDNELIPISQIIDIEYI